MQKIMVALAAIFFCVAGAHGETTRCDLTAPYARSAGAGCERAWMDANLKLNDLVAVGTHNSYKLELPAALMAQVRAAMPDWADEIDYRHRPLLEQLDAGVRQLEIDIYGDPDGGRFLDPAGLRAAGLALDPARRAALAEPGFKVMHVQDFDLFSSCATLKSCLGIVRRWSLAHREHAPILILINAKTGRAPYPGGVDALPFDAAAFDALDREIRAVFPADALITPDDVQGSYPTLREAVLAGAWPTLGKARGKIMFALDEGPDVVAVYRGNRRSLEGRVLFVNADEASPAAAYLTLNDPIAQGKRISKAVAAGFIVRTRADAETIEARANDTRRRDAALASGAQYISTDYMWPEPRWHTDYQVRLPGNAVAICNAARGTGRCGGQVIERVGSASQAYLTPDIAPNGVHILPPPPSPGSPLAIADQKLFQEARVLEGTPRWQLATSDVDTDALEHFACAIGAQLTADNAPALVRLLSRAGTASIVDPVKNHYHVPRPYIGRPDPICQARTDHLASNGDYPSGHTANGWMEALLLAELVPDRATEILTRGRAFGESRMICGAHSRSAVEAVWLAGATATAVLRGSPAFRVDLEAAREEMERIRKVAPAPDPSACRVEAAALATPLYGGTERE